MPENPLGFFRGVATDRVQRLIPTDLWPAYADLAMLFHMQLSEFDALTVSDLRSCLKQADRIHGEVEAAQARSRRR